MINKANHFEETMEAGPHRSALINLRGSIFLVLDNEKCNFSMFTSICINIRNKGNITTFQFIFDNIN